MTEMAAKNSMACASNTLVRKLRAQWVRASSTITEFVQPAIHCSWKPPFIFAIRRKIRTMYCKRKFQGMSFSSSHGRTEHDHRHRLTSFHFHRCNPGNSCRTNASVVVAVDGCRREVGRVCGSNEMRWHWQPPSAESWHKARRLLAQRFGSNVQVHIL